VVADEDDAKRLLAGYYANGDTSRFERSAAVERFYDEIVALYPPLEDIGDLEDAAPTWSATPERSDRIVSMDYSWSASDEFLDDIGRLARKHRLILYDPQGPSIVRPDDPPEAPYVPDVREVARVALIGVGAVAAAIVAWWASITVISWLLIIVAALLALMAAGTLVHYARSRRET
jgi:hypothetical protein